MPELPEVETIRRDLLPSVQGRRITAAWVSEQAPHLVQLFPPEEFCRQLQGRLIKDISRRGKYLVFNLDAGLMWVVHLRMMWLVDDWALVHSRLGPEPLEAEFELAAFQSLLKRRSAPIKSVLLDQTVL